MRISFKTICILILSCLIVSCSSTQCKRKDKVPAMPNDTNVDQNLQISQDGSKPKTVFVSKNDGSLQCGVGQNIPPEEMAKELGDIKVYSLANKHDGMMHIQVCGSSTGQVNIFEIAESDLKKAINKGFKPWQL